MSSEKKSEDLTSSYERVMVTAREARRLNDRYTNRGLTPPKKVTTEAMERVVDGQVEYEMEEEDGADPTPTDEEPRER